MTQQPVFAHPPWVFVYVDGAHEEFPGYIRIREGDGTPGAVVLAIRGNDVLLVDVDRHPLGRRLTELPRGFADAGETPQQAATRELREETGLTVTSDQLVALGEVAPNSGILESTVELFLVRVGEDSPAGRDALLTATDTTEISSVRWIPVSEALAMAADGRIIDAFTLTALFRASLLGLLPAVTTP